VHKNGRATSRRAFGRLKNVGGVGDDGSVSVLGGGLVAALSDYWPERQIIIEHRDALDRLAQELLSRETLDSVQIRRIVAGLPLDEDGPSPRTEPETGKPADKEPVLKPILPPITGSNPATA